MRSERWLGRTEFRPKDYMRTFVGDDEFVPPKRYRSNSSEFVPFYVQKYIDTAEIVRDGRKTGFPEKRFPKLRFRLQLSDMPTLRPSTNFSRQCFATGLCFGTQTHRRCCGEDLLHDVLDDPEPWCDGADADCAA